MLFRSGGPAYTIYKALTAAKLAANLTARGIPAVPIFWMATEDHDFAEVNHTWLFDSDARVARVGVESAITRQRPAGEYPAQPSIEELRAALRGFEHGDAVVAAVQDADTSGATMGSGFRALIVRLLQQVGVLTLDPLDPAIRAVGAPLLASAVRSAPELKAALLARGKELSAAGYHAQVLVEEKTSLFFFLEDGERKTLKLKDAECATLADRATAVSPNEIGRAHV